MTSLTLWKFSHILLLVFWLGTDLGVLILARKFRDSSLSVDTRVVLLQMAMVIDTLPRICFITMLPVGLHLANASGYFSIGAAVLVAAWVLAAILLYVNVMASKHMGQPLGQTLQKLNWVLLTLVGGALMALAVWLLLNEQPVGASWLALKIFIYGFVYLLAIGIDWAFIPVGMQVMKLTQEGSSAELEEEISATISRSLIFVHLVYLAVLAAAFLGTAKITF